MAGNQLFKKLCTPEIIKIGWYLAISDSHDDFVLDPIGYADFASDLTDRLMHLGSEVANHRYRPRHLLDIDVPKSDLSVRPGNVLPIEESVLLHAIIYLLSPKADQALSEEVFSYRLHKDWRKRVNRGQSLFREGDEEIPFLKTKTIRKIDPIESWYMSWPDFDAETSRAFNELGYSFLTKTDITAYFENIDLNILEMQIRRLVGRDEDAIVQVLFRILHGWTRVTSTGTPVGRGIPQGNDVSSFLGNLYLVPLDRALTKFCRNHNGMWCRYVDDVKVMTKNERDARAVVFVINDELRRLHLNLQGSKTKILSGRDLNSELYDRDLDLVNKVWKSVEKINVRSQKDRKIISGHLRELSPIVTRFRSGASKAVKNLSGGDSRLLRRLMTVFGRCSRPQLINVALCSLRTLPELRLLQKSLRYLTQQQYKYHDSIVSQLIQILDEESFMQPFQIAKVLEALRYFHPQHPNDVVSELRKRVFRRREHWLVQQKFAEAVLTFPYRDEWIDKLVGELLQNNHPWVRRAGTVLLARAPVQDVRKRIRKIIYHVDPGVSRLGQHWHKFIDDKEYSLQEIRQLRKGKISDYLLIQYLPCLYIIRCHSDESVIKALREYICTLPKIQSAKLNWHIMQLKQQTSWVITNN